jgi:hypothetical protein
MNCLDATSARIVSRDEDDDTIEMELDESAMQVLAEAAAAAEAGTSAGAAAEWPLGAGVSLRSAPAANQEGAAPHVASSAVREAAPAAVPAGAEMPVITPAAAATRGPVITQRLIVAAGLRKPRPRFGVALASGAVAAALLGGVAYLAAARPSGPVAADVGVGTGTGTSTGALTGTAAGTGAAAAGTATTVGAAAAGTAAAGVVAAPPTDAAAGAVVHVGRAAAAGSLETSPADLTDDLPMRFRNPFDASEVFEFPPGTTPIQARDAVAELLSQRARERLVTSR